MPSLGPQSRRIATASTGVLFLLAAVFAPFGTIAWTYEYNADQINPDDPQLAGLLGVTDNTSFCYDSSNECELANHLKDNGSRIISEETYRAAHGFGPEKDIIIFRNTETKFYHPNITYYENETVRVSLVPVSNATALELVSTPSTTFPRGVQRVVEEGTVRTNRPLAGLAYWGETHAIVAHDGAYYRRGAVTYRSMGSTAELLKLAALAAGAILCFYAGRFE